MSTEPTNFGGRCMVTREFVHLTSAEEAVRKFVRLGYAISSDQVGPKPGEVHLGLADKKEAWAVRVSLTERDAALVGLC